MASGKQVPLEEVVFTAPFEAPKTVLLMVNNPTDLRLSYKWKTTRPKRFRIAPRFGYIAPKSEALVRLTCKPFKTSRPLSDRDHCTLLLVKAPQDAPNKASELWEHGHRLEPKPPHRIVLPMKYEAEPKQDEPGRKGTHEKEKTDGLQEPEEDESDDENASGHWMSSDGEIDAGGTKN